MPSANNRYDSELNVKHRIKTSFGLDEKFVYPEWTGQEENANLTRLTNRPSGNNYWILNIPGTPNVTLKEDTVNVFSRLYLNSVNSLSFIGDSIYIFGTSELPSLWYYAFPTRLSDLTALNQVKVLMLKLQALTLVQQQTEQQQRLVGLAVHQVLEQELLLILQQLLILF